MPRPADSSKWYIPLVAGTEIAARSGGLTSFDPGDILGELPIVCQPAGLLLWFDSGRGVSALATRVALWTDRSTNGNHALQNDPNLRPVQTSTGVDFKD